MISEIEQNNTNALEYSSTTGFEAIYYRLVSALLERGTYLDNDNVLCWIQRRNVAEPGIAARFREGNSQGQLNLSFWHDS
jgi:hypothetical protein